MNKNTHIIMDEDDWIEQYKPIKNPIQDHGSFNSTLFETYGAEMEYVRGQDPRKIWTYIDSEDSDDTLIVEGLHVVNRIGYFITEKQYDPFITYEVRWDY